jgi:hypothetical protein
VNERKYPFMNHGNSSIRLKYRHYEGVRRLNI